nr:putative inactive receptor-like protein kinase [Quercus suber]
MMKKKKVPQAHRISLFNAVSFLFFIIIFSIFVVSGQNCLGDLKFNNTSSTKLVRWDECIFGYLWEGVAYNDASVIGQNLTKESINDGLDHSSSHLGHLCLQNLSLSYNKFSSPQFNMLKNLSSFDLSNSGFAGQIPIEISCLTRLVTLNLSTDSFLSIALQKVEYPNLAILVQTFQNSRNFILIL